jgi:hypothetical protein
MHRPFAAKESRLFTGRSPEKKYMNNQTISKGTPGNLPRLLIKSAERIRAEVLKKRHAAWGKYSWLCLKHCFKNKKDFDKFVRGLTIEDRTKFLKLSAFWYIMGDQPKIPYKQTQSFIIAFSVIEALYTKNDYQQFYNWLGGKKLKNKISELHGDVAGALVVLKDEWKKVYGSTEKLRKFIRENLSDEEKSPLLNYFTVKLGKEDKFRKIKNIDEFSEFLLLIRNAFVHNATIIDVLPDSKSIGSAAIGRLSEDYAFKTSMPFESIDYLFKMAFVRFFKKKHV